MPKKEYKPMDAAKKFGGQTGKAVKAVSKRRSSTRSRLDSIMGQIQQQRQNQTTDSNN